MDQINLRVEPKFIAQHVVSTRQPYDSLDSLVQRVQTIISKRLQGLPLAYCLNSQGFYKHEFYVDENVLIPRPETELLVEFLLENTGHDAFVGEAGVGSGCVSISYLAERPRAHVFGTDVSAAALQVARRNERAILRKPDGRLHLMQASLFEPLQSGQFHALVSNPPYLSKSDASVSPSVVAHEPHVALFSPIASDPLFLVKAVCAQATRVLAPGGKLAVEVGQAQARETMDVCTRLGFSKVGVTVDLGGVERLVWAEWGGSLR